ncbi:host RNA polymerase inhibitor [Enterobacter phage 03_vB_Eclo_IJM]|nr:host RNA polymerase inhibitor [Enterobacter phage 03_vB_Eclo_IJM]
MTCENGCQYAKDVGMENHSCERSCMYEPLEKTYIVELEGRVQSFEVPVYAKSLDEATLIAQDYEDAGFVIGRIRPEHKQ